MGAQAMAMPILVTSSGVTTINGFTYDPTFPLLNIAVELQAIQAALNGGAGGQDVQPGSISAIGGATGKTLAEIKGDLNQLHVSVDKLSTAVLQAADIVNKAITASTGFQATALAIQQMALADQIKHNQFVQTTTNTTRTEANLPIVEVKDDAYTKQVSGAATDVGTLTAQATAGNLITSAVTNAATTAVGLGKTLLASTSTGADLLAQITAWQKSATTFVSDKIAAGNASVAKATARAEAASTAPASGGPPTPTIIK